MMKRDECLRVLARRVTNEIVLSAYSTAFDWFEIAPRALNFYANGAMGLGSSHALGFALGHPDRRVILLDGDGSLLMNLGTLVTIGAARPKNLVHFVARNGVYEANGSHPIPQKNVDFTGLAQAAGYAHCAEFRELATFDAELDALLGRDGPTFATLHIEKGALSPEFNYRKLDDPKLRADFKAALHAG
jgi:sulfopyruvate decarboxylase subunit beta